MTLVIKSINGISYYYYQDRVKTTGKGRARTISTFVGRTDLNPQDLAAAQIIALDRHIVKLFKAASLIKDQGYHFETWQYTQEDLDAFEFVKVIYQIVKNQIQQDELMEYEKMFYNRYVYGTTAIEGNMLSEQETAKVLETGLTVENRPLSDTIAVANYNDVKKFMKDYSAGVSENMIKTVHTILMKGMKGDDGLPIPLGEYRKNGSRIHGLGYTPPPPEAISEHMRYLLAEYDDRIRRKVHPVEAAVIFHQKLEEIHPFKDGNGRTGREILNFMLQKAGYPPIYITPKERKNYIDALEQGNSQNYSPLMTFVATRMAATLWYMFSRTKILDVATEALSKVAASPNEHGIKKVLERLANYHSSPDLP